MGSLKLRDLLKIGTGVGKVFLPGAAGSVLDAVNKNISDTSDPANEAALRKLAETNDEQTAAILALHARLEKLESR